jgi:flagellar hook-length control protein FliK
MIELSITAKSATIASPSTPVAGVAAGGFALALGALTDAPPNPPATTNARQHDADGGKKLPPQTPDTAQDPIATPSVPNAKSPATRRLANIDIEMVQAPPVPVLAHPTAPVSSDAASAKETSDAKPGDDAKTLAAPVIAIFAPPPPILIEPSVVPVSAGDAKPDQPSADKYGVAPVGLTGMVGGAASVTPATVLAASGPPAVTPAVPPTGATALPGGVELLDPGAAAVVATSATDLSPANALRMAASVGTPRFNLAATLTPPVDPAPATVQPARQAFAAALAALSARAPKRDDDVTDPQSLTAASVAPTGDTQIPAAVPQVADGQGAALDLRHDRGLRGMIDHIDALRDDANARDTRIRLVPDALGTVDVAVRRDGDAVHVRFSSANEATRVVLNDAQPRLAQLAEASGLRIAGSSVDSGAGGGQPRPQTPNPTPRRARMSRIDASRAADTATDQRLA